MYRDVLNRLNQVLDLSEGEATDPETTRALLDDVETLLWLPSGAPTLDEQIKAVVAHELPEANLIAWARGHLE